MKQFEFTITEPVGIHARPAGFLAQAAKGLSSEITITKGNASASAKKLIAVMGLGVKCGDTVTVSVEGENEAEDQQTIERYMREHL